MDATHVANRYDGSIAGFVFNELGRLDFRRAILSKLERELGFTKEELDRLVLNHDGYKLSIIDIHNSVGLDFSGMVDFRIDIPMKFEDIIKRVNSKYLTAVTSVSKENISQFVYEHLVTPKSQDDELILDGAASLLCSLAESEFLEAVKEINKNNETIKFKKLIDGQLVEQKRKSL